MTGVSASRVAARIGSAEFFAAYAGPPPSLVFIDGDHSCEAVRRDIAGAQRIGAEVIGGHDYAPAIPGVVQAVEERFPGATVRRDTAWMWGLEEGPVA